MTLTVRHNAPTLNATGACPSCGAPIEPEAVLCTACGMDFASGNRIRKAGSGWKRLVPGLLVLAILTAGLLAFFRLGGHPEAASEEADPIAPAVTEESAAAIAPQTEDPRAAFEAKKRQATQQAREQLDDLQPRVQVGEAVDLRRKNGLVYRGTLQGYSGSGTGRVAIVATATGEVGIPLTALDKPSRRQADPEYRKQFLQHLMSQETE
jgi:zinc-ribbon domain